MRRLFQSNHSWYISQENIGSIKLADQYTPSDHNPLSSFTSPRVLPLPPGRLTAEQPLGRAQVELLKVIFEVRSEAFKHFYGIDGKKSLRSMKVRLLVCVFAP